MKPLYSTPIAFKPMKEEPVWEEAPMLCDDGIWRGRYRYGSGDSWDVAVDEFQPPYLPGEKCLDKSTGKVVTILSCEPIRVSEVKEEDCLAVGLKKLSKDNGRTWKFGMADRDGLPGTDNTGWEWADWKVDHREAFKIWWNKDKEWAWRVVSEEEK